MDGATAGYLTNVNLSNGVDHPAGPISPGDIITDDLTIDNVTEKPEEKIDHPSSAVVEEVAEAMVVTGVETTTEMVGQIGILTRETALVYTDDEIKRYQPPLPADQVKPLTEFEVRVTKTDQNQVDKTKKFLSSKFSMKDMGEADVILGIKIKRENKGIVITQSHYIEKILKKFNREDCSPVSTPITRPDIAYAVGRLSSFTSNRRFTSRQHWHAITRAFKKQTCITGSTIESEFVALVAAGKEAEWLRNLIHEIPIWLKPMLQKSA
ncbi:zinc finger, CCHC-type containing protein [Tanacetum coccineum]